MKRRDFMASAAALIAFTPAAFAAEPIFYAPGTAEADMNNGKVVFLDFWASWCGTCAAQERALTKLKAGNPEYEKYITFYKIDWDQFGNGDLSKSLKIPRRSTLVVMNGNTEVARIVAGTSPNAIKGLLDQALKIAKNA